MRRVSRKELIRANLGVGDGMGFSYGTSDLITYTVELDLWNRLRKATRAAQIKPYKSLTNIEGTRRVAGLVFESLAQETLQNEIKLDLVPMGKKQSGGSGGGKKLYRWHSCRGDSASSSSVRPTCIKPDYTEVYSGSCSDQVKD
ncbi:hypothetical protein V8E53_013727 [Lactarius tabidus]|jgi:hypothetical protein